jgi:release factor glutamine methyltransferase
VAADAEAAELLEVARDAHELRSLLRRRVKGEPLAWITGQVRFCDVDVAVHRDVYVPRWQTEVVARSAVGALPERGVAVDLCCGTGAVAAVLQSERPEASVFASDIDARAVACARINGVDARRGDLFAPLPEAVCGLVDVVVAVTPYVPTDELIYLARSAEPLRAVDGGVDGLALVRRIAREAPAWLRGHGAVILEIGAPQVGPAESLLAACGFGRAEVLYYGDGDVCGVRARLSS